MVVAPEHPLITQVKKILSLVVYILHVRLKECLHPSFDAVKGSYECAARLNGEVSAVLMLLRAPLSHILTLQMVG